MFSRIMTFYNGRKKFGKKCLYFEEYLNYYQDYKQKPWQLLVFTSCSWTKYLSRYNANIEFGEELSKILIIKILI